MDAATVKDAADAPTNLSRMLKLKLGTAAFALSFNAPLKKFVDI